VAGAAAETGTAEKAAEILIFLQLFLGLLFAPLDHVIAKRPRRDAPMRASACPETDLPRK
jgi:hypothetical protein